MYRIALALALVLLIAVSAYAGDREIVDQEKLYYSGYSYMLYYTDSNNDYAHTPGEQYYAYPYGNTYNYDMSCWYASACAIMEGEGHGNPYTVGLRDGAAYSPAVSPWGNSFYANSGDYRTFDDGGWQHWAFDFEGMDYQPFIKSDEEFGSGSWSINPVTWSQTRIAEGHGVGVCLYSGKMTRGMLPSGYDASGRYYHAITIWEIDNNTMVITDSDDQVYGSRTVNYTYSGNDWVIQELYPGSNAHINYCVALEGGGQPQCCDVDMTPDNDPVIVDPGGSFGFTGYIGNPTPDPITVDVWGGVIYQGNFYRQFRYLNIYLNAGDSRTAHGSQHVPNFAPPGTYTYIAYCGDYNNEICDSASFPFSVSGGGQVEVIDFEEVPEQYWYFGGGQNLGGFYPGLNFGSSVTILENQVYGYNDTGYPPHSGHQVAFTADVPTIRVDFDALVNHVGVWYTVGSGTLYLEGYNSGGGLVDNTSGGENYGTNDYIEVNGANIAYALIHNSADFYTIDDFEYGSTLSRQSFNAEGWVLEGFFNDETAGTTPVTYATVNNYPNPFNAQTSINFRAPVSVQVNLEVYNLMGQRVATLVDGNIEAGNHSVIWDAQNQASGVYFYKLSIGENVISKRMTLLK
ncbi:MAG: T9SS type A sorting domain-containing protein [candidate division Zixibacteria bacterium]|nr:T9SS type A sorting domain-containing protein [candidate division Zixibacteria bacterium]